jgi:hypothetical protein
VVPGRQPPAEADSVGDHLGGVRTHEGGAVAGGRAHSSGTDSERHVRLLSSSRVLLSRCTTRVR